MIEDFFLSLKTMFDVYQPFVWWFIGTLLVFYLFRTLVIARLHSLSRKTKNSIDNLIADLLKTIDGAFAIALGASIGFASIHISLFDHPILLAALVALFTWQIAKSVNVLVEYAVRRFVGDEHSGAFHSLRTIIKILIWTSGALFLLGSLGFNINSLVAGLGIGGIAVALAVQNVLSDLFSSFSLYADKPFGVGDYIVYKNQGGIVQQIGLKTTRMKSLRGEEIIIPNKDLTAVSVQNFGKLSRRRVDDVIGFSYESSSRTLESTPNEIQKIIEGFEFCEFDRFTFKSFGAHALEWELIYYFDSGDYNAYMSTRHAINMALKTHFEKKKLSIAYPTQTIYLKKDV